jgi:hypothetical protein
MKAVLEFYLPEESAQHMIAANASDVASTILLIDEKCRHIIKYGYDGSIDQLAQSIRYEINSVRHLLDQ